MPTYEYACKQCGQHLEVTQGFRDDPLTTCPHCGGVLRKVFGSIGIAFKGSGFYKTDSRAAARSEGGSSAGSGSSESSSSSGSGSSDSGSSGSGSSGSASSGPRSPGSGDSSKAGSGSASKSSAAS